MASRTPVSRLVSGFDRRWLFAILAVVAVVLVARSMPRGVPDTPLQLVVLGPDGGFRDTVLVPASWGDTVRGAPGVVRVPLVLAVRNTGDRSGRPEALALSVPASYRLVAPGVGLEATRPAGSALVAYTVETALEPVEPGRMPTLMPGLDTLWLEVVVPSFHCVALTDSVPEFIPASPPPLETMSRVRIFYSFEGGDLSQRRTGTLAIQLDTALFDIPTTEPSATFPVVLDTAEANPATGPLQVAGRGRSQCGDPQDPLELETTLWLNPAGGRVIGLARNGLLRKRLFDLDADGVIERESWDADGDGVFEATRRVRLPAAEFLISLRPVGGTAADTVGVGPG